MAALVSVQGALPYCGATIVSPTFVVTAAHCLRVTTTSNTVVVVGEHDTSTGQKV